MMNFLLAKPAQSFTLDLTVRSLWAQAQFVKVIVQGTATGRTH
jgi:hypothetical protein